MPTSPPSEPTPNLPEQFALLDLAHDSIIVCDMDSRVVFWNHGAEQKYGWTKQEASAQTVDQLLHTRFPQSRSQIFSELLRDGHWEGELIHTRRDGSLITVTSRWALQRDPKGVPKRILEINNDITEQKRGEQRLRESEERLRELFEHASELIQSVTPEGRVLFVNPAWKVALGYSEADFASFSMPDIVAPEVREAWIDTCSRVLNGADLDRFETTFLAKDGRPVHVSGRISCRFDDTGTPSYASGIFRDVTKAREVERLKNEFVSVVSHELRTPLTSIRGSLGLLAGGMIHHLPEKGRRMLTIALNNTDRLVRLINDILDMERIQSGKVPMQKKLITADDVMRQSVDVVQAVAEKAGVLLVFNGAPIPLFLDPDRIIQTFTNLMSNAIKFSQPGAAVSFSVALQDGNAVFKVQDTGRGIPADKLELVFERFQQVDASDSRVKGGTGLGLPICRTIVDQHEGKIWAESAFGSGSSFFVSLPVAATKPEAADAVGDCATAPGTAATGNIPIDVLLVEDDIDLANVLRATFESDGVRVRHATTGRQAVAMTRSETPGLIVLDVSIPDGDGFSVVNALRQDNDLRQLPLMVYSAKDLSRVERRNLELGRTEFFTKARIPPDEFERRAVDFLREITQKKKAASAR